MMLHYNMVEVVVVLNIFKLLNQPYTRSVTSPQLPNPNPTYFQVLRGFRNKSFHKCQFGIFSMSIKEHEHTEESFDAFLRPSLHY